MLIEKIMVYEEKVTVEFKSGTSLKVKCIENGTTQAQIAEDIQTTKSYVNRIIKKQWSSVKLTDKSFE